MSTPATPSDPVPVAVPPSAEDKLRRAWERYGSLVYITLGVVVLAILAKGGLDYLNTQKEFGIKQEFAEAKTPDALKTFAANHPGHPLAGAAELSIADDAYAQGKFTDAATEYSAAATDLPAGPFRANAKMGQAIALLQSGKPADAEALLRQLMNDASLLKAVRCEAGYHLAEIALAGHRGDEVQKISEQVMAIDPTSPFAERAFSLRPPAAAAAVSVAPAGSAPKP